VSSADAAIDAAGHFKPADGHLPVREPSRPPCDKLSNWTISEGVMTVLEWLSTERARATRKTAEFDSGILIFCGIGLLLSLAAMLFGWFGLDGAVSF
jgi:hypothetical protein